MYRYAPMATATASPKPIQITLTISENHKRFLEALTETESFGRSVAETARWLLQERINQMIQSGDLDRHQSAAEKLRSYQPRVGSAA
jgi:hypothetical protein